MKILEYQFKEGTEAGWEFDKIQCFSRANGDRKNSISKYHFQRWPCSCKRHEINQCWNLGYQI